MSPLAIVGCIAACAAAAIFFSARAAIRSAYSYGILRPEEANRIAAGITLAAFLWFIILVFWLVAPLYVLIPRIWHP